jgi:hypothetical protein
MPYRREAPKPPVNEQKDRPTKERKHWLYQKPTMHPHCESFLVQRAFFQVGKFIKLRIGPARHRIE